MSLIDRAEVAGLLIRRADADDARVVRLALTPLGRRRLERLAELHFEELARLGPQLSRLWAGLPANEVAQQARAGR